MSTIETPKQVVETQKEDETKLVDDNSLKKAKMLGSVKSKYSKSEWEATEKKLDEFSLKVLKMLFNYFGDSKSKEDIIEDNFYVLGDKFYIMIRDIIKQWDSKIPLVKGSVSIPHHKEDDKKKNKHQKKKGMTADEIRENNSKKKVDELINVLLNGFSKTNLTADSGLFLTKYLELRAITLMYISWFVFNNEKKFQKKQQQAKVYELIVGIQKFMNTTQKYIGNSIIDTSKKEDFSTIIQMDLKYWLDKLTSKYPFDGIKIYDIAPKIIFSTFYDDVPPKTGIQPRTTQIQLKEMIQNHNRGFLISFNAPINSGKTTAVIGVASYINNIRIQEKAKGKECNIELIFACNLQTVKAQVSNLCYNNKIAFGLAHIDHKTGNPRIINSYSVKRDSDRLVIVTSPDTAYHIITKNKDKEYWLFLDEPTVGADQYGSNELRDNVNLMMNMPKWTILSSATTPEFKTIPNIINPHLKKFPDIFVGTIYSSDIQTGCSLKTFEQELVLPHIGCKTKEQLEYVITKINSNNFLRRMYTPKVSLQMYNTFIENKIRDVPDIAVMFSDVNNLSATKVCNVSIEMLNTLLKLDNSIIQKVCESKITDIQDIEESNKKETQQSQEQDAFEWDDGGDETEVETNVIDFNLLTTKQAYKFTRMTLIADNNPVAFCEKYFMNIVNQLFDEKYDLKKIIAKYERECLEYETEILRREEKAGISQSEDNSKKTKIIGKLNEKIQNDTLLEEPKLNFPNWAQINSKEHIRKYARSHVSELTPSDIRALNNLESLPYDSGVPEWITILLFCGIGIYSPGNISLDKEYTACVLDLATQGRLSYLVADNSISYGTNFPIGIVVVSEDFFNTHSINTIFQLLGRAGRIGQAWKADAYISNSSAVKLINFIHQKDNVSGLLEANNMNNYCKELISKEQEKMDKIHQEEEEFKQQEEEREKIRLQQEAHRQHLLKLEQERFRQEQIKKREQDSWRNKQEEVTTIGNLQKTYKQPAKQQTYKPRKQDTDDKWR